MSDQEKIEALERQVAELSESLAKLHDHVFGAFDDRIRALEKHPHLKNEGE